MKLLGIAAGVVDGVGAGEVKPKERLVKGVKLLVKAGPQVTLAQAARKHGLLPAKRRELLDQGVDLLYQSLLANQLHERAALELALVGARNGKQAVLAKLASLDKVVHRLGEDVYAAQARGGVEQVAQDLVGTLRLLLGLPGREERDERAEPAHGHAKVAEGVDVIRVGKEALGLGGELAGRSRDLPLDGDERAPRAGLGAVDKPQERGRGGQGGRRASRLPLGGRCGLGELEGNRGALRQPDLAAKQVRRDGVERGHVADHDHGLLRSGGDLAEKGVIVLVVERLVDLDAVDAQDACDDLRRLHGPNRGARPHVYVVVVLEQRERARVCNLEGMPAIRRELAVKVRRVVLRLLGLAMPHENKGPDHETTSADATLPPTR